MTEETTMPPEITDPILRLCARVNSLYVPQYVPVVPGDEFEPNECFHNVERQLSKLGGDISHGWTIWEWPKVLVEAEFHANWVSPNGEVIDVTPKTANEEKILFLPDPEKKWDGKYIDNIREPLFESRLFQDLDRVRSRLVYEQNHGVRVPGGVEMNARKVQPLLDVNLAIRLLLTERGNEHSLCPCGSGRKYKNCHQKQLYR